METLTAKITDKVDLLKVLFNNGNEALWNRNKVDGIDFNSIDSNGNLEIKFQDCSKRKVNIDEIEIYEHQKPTRPERIYIPDCAWDKNPVIYEERTHYEISYSKGFGNSRHSETFDNLVDAVKFAKTKRNKGDEYDKYWNGYDEIITKVTTINEIVRVVKSSEKE